MTLGCESRDRPRDKGMRSGDEVLDTDYVHWFAIVKALADGADGADGGSQMPRDNELSHEVEREFE